MTTSLHSRSLAAILVASSWGCGGSAATTDAARAVDAASGTSIVGTWGRTVCFQPDEQMDCDYTLTYDAGGTHSIRLSSVKLLTTTTGFAGCTITLNATGYTYVADGTTLTVTAGASAAMTVTRTGCADPTDDQPDPTPSADFTPSSFEVPGAPYTVTATELAVGGAGALVYTRR